jgi:hypothetical protein
MSQPILVYSWLAITYSIHFLCMQVGRKKWNIFIHPFINFLTFSLCGLSSYILLLLSGELLSTILHNSDSGNTFCGFYSVFFVFQLHNFNHFLITLVICSFVHQALTVVVPLNLFYTHLHYFCIILMMISISLLVFSSCIGFPFSYFFNIVAHKPLIVH